MIFFLLLLFCLCECVCVCVCVMGGGGLTNAQTLKKSDTSCSDLAVKKS